MSDERLRASDPIAETKPLSYPSSDDLGRAHAGPWEVALLLYGKDEVTRGVLTTGAALVVGRDAASGLSLPEATLSREHARFTLEGGVVLVEDLGSTNGTWLAGRRIDRAEARPGDELFLGGVAVVIQADGAASARGLESHERFRLALEQEMGRAGHLDRRLAVLMVRAPDGALDHVSRWFHRVRRHLRPIDRVALYSLDTVEVLLLEADLDKAAEVASAIASSGGAGEPTLLVGLAPFPEAATDAERLLAFSRSALRRADEAHPVASASTLPWSSAREACAGLDASQPLVASAATRRVFELADRLARAVIPVLIQGETGTGKELVARAIHERGPRRLGPMVCVNCGAIPGALTGSVLFGHERGAFTGAHQAQKGIFEAADGGTVFLDEIAELPAAAQTALLRVLETGQVSRLGSTKELEVSLRVLAATHQDLEARCEDGGFRRDLLYRLNTMTITIPPLRARKEEIEPLVERFLQLANQANGLRIRRVDADALALLQRYSWPGNVRELRNAIDRAAVIASGDEIREQDLPERVRAGAMSTERPSPLPARPDAAAAAEEEEEPPAAPESADAGDDLRASVLRYERQLIVDALGATGWSLTKGAQRLGLPLRTLHRKLQLLGIKKLGFGPSD